MMRMIPKKEFMDELFVTCDKCGYNNLKKRFSNFGCCLGCGEVLDKKSYFKFMMRKIAKRCPRNRRIKRNRSVLYF